MPLKLVFAGTSEFAVTSLEALLHSNHSIIAVYTQPDRPAGRGLKLKASPVKQAALRYGLTVHQPSSLSDASTQAEFKALKTDLMGVVVYGLLVPKAILDTPRYGCINVHPSLLPRWRGATPLQRAIEMGDAETGVTIMQLDEGWDTGDILMQTRCPIHPTDTSQTLHDRLAHVGADLLVRTIDELESGSITPVPQNEAGVVYAPKLEKSEGELNWKESAVTLERKIRAFNPWPVAYTHWEDKILRIWQAQVLSENLPQVLPGTIIAISSDGIDVVTGSGVLRLLKIQMPGGKPLDVGDFIHAQGRFLLPIHSVFY